MNGELEAALNAVRDEWPHTPESEAAMERVRRLFAARPSTCVTCGEPCHACAGRDACREACRDEASV